MTVETDLDRAQYATNATTGPWTVPFYFLADTELAVTYTGSGVDTTLTLDVDYTVSGAGDEDGGTITTTQAYAAGGTLVILRNVEFIQPIEYTDGDGFPAKTHERGLDRLTMIAQQLREQFSRAITFPPSYEGGASVLPSAAARANQLFGFNSVGDPIAVAPVSGTATDLGIQLALAVSGHGADQVGLYDPLAPTFLKLTSDLLNLNEVSILRFVNRTKWSAIGAGTNADDLSSNWNTAMAAGSGKGLRLYVPPGLHNANNIAVQSDNTSIRGAKGATLKSTTAGHHILEAAGRTGVKLEGLKFQGLGSSTFPVATVGGYEAKGTGLVDFAGCTDVKVFDCELSDFYTLLTAVKCTQVVFERNNIHNWYLFGVLASLSNSLRGVGNFIHDSDFAGAGNSYCFSATGDTLNSSPESGINWSHNFMWNCPAWDAVMCHEVNNLTAIANQIWNVRVGFDLTASLVTNVFTNIILALNNIRGTATDTWAGGAAQHAGIYCNGFDATHQMAGLQLLGNIVDSFFTNPAMVNAGNTANIAVVNTKGAALTGNVVRNAGSLSNAGILVAGACDGLSITGGSLQGSMAQGGVRFVSATGAAVQVGGISITQTTATDPAVNVSGSALSALSIETCPTNSTSPLVVSTSTVAWANTGTFSATVVGCTSSVTGNVEYSLNGQMVTLTFPAILGSSNTTGLSLTGLPPFLQPVSANCVVPMNAQDNSAFAPNVTGAISIGSGTIVLSKSGNSAGWTGAGTKGVSVTTITYSL